MPCAASADLARAMHSNVVAIWLGTKTLQRRSNDYAVSSGHNLKDDPASGYLICHLDQDFARKRSC